jgi:hypothetical protein
MSPSQPRVTSHCLSPPTHTPSLTVSSDKQQITQKALNADVLHTDRHPRCAAMQLLQQPVLQQNQRLEFLNSKRCIENLDEKQRQFSYCTDVRAGRWRRHRSTDYYPTQYVKLSGQFHAAANLPPVHFG